MRGRAPPVNPPPHARGRRQVGKRAPQDHERHRPGKPEAHPHPKQGKHSRRTPRTPRQLRQQKRQPHAQGRGHQRDPQHPEQGCIARQRRGLLGVAEAQPGKARKENTEKGL